MSRDMISMTQHSLSYFAVLFVVSLVSLSSFAGYSQEVTDDEATALSLAAMLRAARTVVAENQYLINDPDKADKGLSGELVATRAEEIFEKTTGRALEAIDPNSREGRLLKAQLESVVEVMDEYQDLLNREGVGFKGFVPAVFGRLVNERFAEKVGDEAQIKVTAPVELIRNRKARPDTWERAQIEERLGRSDWPHGDIISAETEVKGKPAYRVLVPEYYSEACLACHGGPAGEVDVTGYPKEGAKLGDLGGAISITLFR